jgi:hypothetical protein
MYLLLKMGNHRIIAYMDAGVPLLGFPVIKMYPSKTTTMEYPPASQPEIFYSCA